MYIPGHFEVTDEEEIFAFIAENSFGQLISTVGGRLFSTHMPFLLSEDKSRVFAHLAAQNPQHAELDGQEVLISLQGEHAYISPSWYETPGVPTWNYQSVHIYGQAGVFTAADKLQWVVETLTQKYESTLPQPWQPDYRSTMLQAIVGVEVTVSEIQCKYKLSQNRPARDRSRVAAALKENGSTALAAIMARKTV